MTAQRPQCWLKYLTISSVFLFAAALPALGQQHFPGHPVGAQPRPSTPPPMFVKFIGPKGMKITFYRGNKQAQTVETPTMVGLRPGYVYRIKITGVPNYPQPIFPTLEVRGSLVSDGKVRPQDFPAAMVFSLEDFASLRRGSYITKVVVLERVKTALPEATTADNPIQIRTYGNGNPLQQAHRMGTPLVILRMGQRDVSEEELLQRGLYGTIQLPAEKALPLPKVAPFLPWTCPALYDPRLGPGTPGANLCLPDGGDAGLKMGFDEHGRLSGFEPSETVAEYTNSKGIRQLAVSNRVCICVPRFLIVRGEINLQNQKVYVTTSNAKSTLAGQAMAKVAAVSKHHQNLQLGGLYGNTSVSGAQSATGAVIYGQVEGLEVYASVDGLRGVSSTCKTPEEVELPDQPLLLVKWPDKYGATVGEIITFTLKYTNQGGRPIRKVVLLDNLTGRYEYIPGSSKSDRPATFTTNANQSGSLILRWEINDELPPGQSGLIQFQVKVR